MRAPDDGGSVLVEFALVALVLSLLLAVAVDFGRLLFSAQALQDVARVMAREISVAPLPPDMVFDEMLDDPRVLQRIFDASRLVVDTTGWTDTDFEDYIRDPLLPVVNRALLPLMIFDQVGDTRLWRYPGALLEDAGSLSGFTVGIPRIGGRDANGAETIEWVPVVQELADGHFRVDCPPPGPCGLAAVRINYPYQAGALTAFQRNEEQPFEPNIDNPIDARDDEVTEINPGDAPGALLADDPDAVGTFAGPFGLGRQYAFARTVRPFRRLLSAQAIYRREVFE